ncbi:PQQ-binding-like beta-propeller repeat protein, partial [Streptomyces sp. PU-14G]|uniref:outer membrane protein assembly factor BamB family protein n=1 Tax=Streptomyces sp. PU-14G TaxID=2800808 RepID=UPI0034DEDE3E
PARDHRLLAPSRRSLLTAVGTGVAGVAVGGSVAWAVTSDPAPELTPAEKLAARRKTRKRLKGAPPTPKWRYDLADPVKNFAPLLWRDEVAVLADGTAAVGVAVRTGDELWRRADTKPSGRAWPLSNGLVLLAGSDLFALGARDGETRWRSERYRKAGRRPYTAVLAAHGHVVWLVVENTRSSSSSSSSSPSSSRTVVAYDLTDDRELWSNPLPAGYQGSHLLGDTLVVVTADKGKPPRLTAYDRETGRERWSRTYESAESAHLTTVAEPATLVTAKGASLRAYALGGKGKERWKVTAEDENEQKPDFLGTPVTHKHSVYVSDSAYVTHCVDARTGKVSWRSEATFDLEPTARDATPDTAVTPNGRVLVSANDAEVDAFETRHGSLLWRFTDLPSASGTVLERRKVALNDEYVLVVSGRSVYALPLG